MKVNAKLLLGIIVFLIILLLGVNIFLSSSRFKIFISQETKPHLSQDSSIKEDTIAELLGLGQSYGVRKYKNEEKDIYEIIGWVSKFDEQTRKVSLMHEESDWEDTAYLKENTSINRLTVLSKEQIFSETATLEDLVPQKVRILAQCVDEKCNELESVFIIDIK
jgi:hypothetical protein